MRTEKEIAEYLKSEQMAFFIDPFEDREARLARIIALRWVLGEV